MSHSLGTQIFIRQELNFRLFIACIISMFLSTTLLFSISCIFSISLTYPWYWVIDAIRKAFTLRHIIGYSTSSLAICLLLFFHKSRLSVVDQVVNKYSQIYTQLLWDNCGLIAFSTILATVQSYFVLSLLASPYYTSFFYNSFRLNPRTYTLMTFGAFLGLINSVTTVLFNRLTIPYTHTHSTYTDLVKDHLATRSLSTIGRICYFVPIFVLCPALLDQIPGSRWQIFVLFLDIRMLFLMFLVGFHLQFSWGCAITILRWQVSKTISTPITESVEIGKQGESVFSNSMDPLVKHLTLEHIADLVATDPSFRASVFSLNTLSGRSLLWLELSTWCINLLERFTSNTQCVNQEIVQRNFRVSAPHRHYDLPKTIRPPLRPSVHAVDGLGPPISETMTSQPNGEVTTSHSSSVFDLLIDGNMKSVAQTVIVKTLHVVERLPFLQSINSDIPYATTAGLFTGSLPNLKTSNLPLTNNQNGQSVIWATEILACLTLASYTEDAYGCVQRSLGQILTLLVECLEAVERHLRLVNLLTKERHQGIECDLIMDGADVQPNMAFNPPSPTPLQFNPATDNSDCPSRIDDANIRGYYRFSSDPSLPWRVYATLMWAVSNCLNLFGNHLESLQVSQKAKNKLRSLRATYLHSEGVDISFSQC